MKRTLIFILAMAFAVPATADSLSDMVQGLVAAIGARPAQLESSLESEDFVCLPPAADFSVRCYFGEVDILFLGQGSPLKAASYVFKDPSAFKCSTMVTTLTARRGAPMVLPDQLFVWSLAPGRHLGVQWTKNATVNSCTIAVQ